MNTSNRLLLQITTLIIVIVAIISIFGMILYRDSPKTLQGEIECPQIKISGKLLGRVEKIYIQEGSKVIQGEPLVLINSPETDALMQSDSAMKEAAQYKSEKIDNGTRSQITESLKEIWNAAKAQAALATTTNERIERLYKDSVVTLQRKEESNAMAQAAQAAEMAARYQYEMALEGARKEDKGSARAMVSAAQGNVEEIGSLLKDTTLTAPTDGTISEIYPSEGELLMPGATIMDLLLLEQSYAVFNIREDILQDFLPGKTFTGTVPALGNASILFEVYYTSPLGSYATWQSSKENNSYNLVTFKIKARPAQNTNTSTLLRPGMSVIVQYKVK